MRKLGIIDASRNKTNRELIGNYYVEEIICKNGPTSEYYATELLRGRFKKGEPEILNKKSKFIPLWYLHNLKNMGMEDVANELREEYEIWHP